MKGSFKKDETKNASEMMQVLAVELEKRRQKMQAEMDTAQRSYKNKLDTEHSAIVSKHEKEHNDKMIAIDKRESILKKGEISLANKEETSRTSIKASLETAEKKSREFDTLIKENNKKIEVLEIEYKSKKADIDKKSADIVSERESIKNSEKALKDAQAALVTLQKQNKEESIRLDNLIREYEGKVNYIDFQKIEINEKAKALDDREFIISEDEIETERRLSDAKKFEHATEAALTVANQVAEDNAKEEAKLKTEASRIDTLSISLSELRNTLTEKELSNVEKDRYLILKGRDIDGKIRILNELRKK